MSGYNPNDPFARDPRRSSPWASSGRRARSFEDPAGAAPFSPFDDQNPWGSPAAESPAPEGTLGTAVIAGLVLVALVALSCWRLLGGPVDPVGALGWALLPLVGALLVTIGAAIDEERRRPLARAAGALFLLSLLLLLRRVDLFAGALGLLTFCSVLALSVALRPFANRLRRESGLPDLGAGWWIWSAVAAYAWTSLDLFATVKVALVGYLLEWAGPALDRQTAAARERLIGLFRPRQIEPEIPTVALDDYPDAPPGATTREHREVAKAIVSFVQQNFGMKYAWSYPVVSEVLGRAPKFTTYILKVPANVPADLLLSRSTDLATFLSDQRGSDGMVVRKRGFREIDVSIKSASEKGGVRIEIRKPESQAEPAWFEPSFREYFSRAISQFEKPDQPQYAAIIGVDEAGEPVVAKVAGRGAQPQLLIAGATGSGKSYLMHLILVQLLMQYGPDDLRLAVVDPKRVGVGIRYRRVPHLIAPVASATNDTVALMKRVHDEMEERYALLEGAEANSLEDYNYPRELMDLEGKRTTDARRRGDLQELAQIQARIIEIKARRLPVILFVIDEVSDFTDAADKTTTEAYRKYVGGIARKGRAAGVLLIIGVQRPSQYNVGENIRNNLTQRIALQLLTAGESEMILGKEAGDAATRLSPKGDGIYYLNGERSRFQALLIPDRAADRFGAGENHLLTEDYIKKIIARWGGENDFTAATPAPSVGATKSALLSAAHGPQCDDREWLIIRGLSLATSGLTDIYDDISLSLAEIAAWSRKAAEEYKYLGPAMSEGEVERALQRFYPNDPDILRGGVYHANRTIVGPYLAPGRATDSSLYGRFAAAAAAATDPAARNAASVIEEIRSRPSRDQ